MKSAIATGGNMQPEENIRAQAMVNALSAQRQQAADQAVMLAADLAVANARIAELEAKLKAEQPSE